MKIQMDSTVALREIHKRYRGLSDPLTHHRNVRHDTQDIRAWLSSMTDEAVDHDRKYKAIPFYLEICSAPHGVLDGYSFAADLEFSDGAILHPDKGIVKALYSHGLIRDEVRNGELIFSLSPSVKARFEAGRK